MSSERNDLHAQLLETISNGTPTIGIIGLGYVGLPLAFTFVERGLPVLGFDVDPDKIAALGEGRSYIEHIPSARVADAARTGRFEATTDFARLGEPDALLICVPTPLTIQREPEMRYVEQTTEKISATLRRGQLIVLESTTYPGTTDGLLRSILERNGLKCSEDFFLAYSPEREDPGNPDFVTSTIPKVVGGVDEASGQLANALYQRIVERTVLVTSARAAEATKLTENIFRSVNIALVNELKVVYDRMGIDVWEILDAAESKPFGFMKFSPGPGWGGHCIPIDPFYLAWKAREFGVATKFIELAGEVNVEMPSYVVSKVQHALNDRGLALKGSKLLVLGIAYKKDVDDARESPAFVIIEQLRELGAEVVFHDPHVKQMPRTRRWSHLMDLSGVDLTAQTLAAQDAVVLITDHTAVDYALVGEHAKVVIDTRGVYREPRSNVVKA
jgi:UDP-N-acetyl-D-glucosamine dehydrogenase